MKYLLIILLTTTFLCFTQLQLLAQCDCAPCQPAVPITETEDLIIYINVNTDGNADCDLSSNPVQNFLLDFNHSYLGDLDVTLTSPMGQSIFLIRNADYFGLTDNSNGEGDRFTPTFLPNNQEALQGNFENKTVSQKTRMGILDNISGEYYPFANDFAQLTGDLCGQWQLRISDNFSQDAGQLNQLQLNFTNQNGIDCASSQNALSAELIEFRAFPHDEVNIIEWLTATEVNTKWHIIERSTDGMTFTEIAREAAQGTKTTATSYRFTDSKPLFTAFYRIQTIDINGDIEYSHVVNVNRELPETVILQAVYPSPAVEQIFVDYSLPTSANLSLQLFDLNGQLLNNNNLPAQKGTHTTSIDIASYPSGFYFLVLKSNNTRIVKRVIKQ